MTNIDPAAAGWHVDRRIPVAWIMSVAFALFAQLAGAVWVASGFAQSIENNASGIQEVKSGDLPLIRQQIETFRDQRQSIKERVIILEQKLDSQKQQLIMQTKILDRIEKAVTK